MPRFSLLTVLVSIPIRSSHMVSVILIHNGDSVDYHAILSWFLSRLYPLYLPSDSGLCLVDALASRNGIALPHRLESQRMSFAGPTLGHVAMHWCESSGVEDG